MPLPYELTCQLDNLLSMSCKDEIIKYMISKYASKTVSNAREILQFIPEVTDILMKKEEEIARRNKEAAFWLMIQESLDDMDPVACFASMVPVCMVFFPDGTDFYCCEAEKKYYNKFVKLFKNKKAFNWEKDKAWADQYGYTEYLKLVEDKLKVGSTNGRSKTN